MTEEVNHDHLNCPICTDEEEIIRSQQEAETLLLRKLKYPSKLKEETVREAIRVLSKPPPQQESVMSDQLMISQHRIAALRTALEEIKDVAQASEGVEFYAMLADKALTRDDDSSTLERSPDKPEDPEEPVL